jgi:stage V sporulation protein S
VAGAIAGEVRGQGRVEVQAMGADAVNQAIKAIALARDYLRESGIEAVCLPRLVGIDFDGDARTAVTLVVEAR